MHNHPEEVRWAQVNEKQLPFEPLNRTQVHSIMERGRELHRGYKAHFVLHCLISLFVLVVLLGGDYLALLRLPGLWLASGSHNPAGAIVTAGVICGLLHCWLMYSLGVFTMHEERSPQNHLSAPWSAQPFRQLRLPLILAASPAEFLTSTPKNT